METIINLIVSNGVAVVIVGYFIYKDYRTTSQMVSVLGEIKEIIAVVKEKL